jgi:CubicO group peptidase (beta-lactamase class C family)
MRARAQRTFFAALFAAGILLVNPDSTATEPFATLDAELGAVVNDPAHPLASLSVLAIRDGAVVYQRQFGYRHIDPAISANNLPADPDTLYRVASISKLVTALGAMKLVEQGKLSLDADVGPLLGYPLRNPHFPSRAITLRMLLSHTSSLRDDAGYFWDARHALKDLLSPGGSLYGSGAMWARNAPPGGYFSYTNLNSAIVAALMERAGGERFDRLMQRLILVPMGLRGGFNPAEFSAAELNNLAALYRKRSEINGKEIWNSTGPWVPQVDDYSRNPPLPRAGPDYVLGSNGTLQSPQGGLRISAADLGKIMLMLINQGKHEGRQILKAASLAAMFAEQWRHDGKSGNGDTYRGLFHAWGLGNQHFLDLSAPGSGDRLVEGGGFTGVGHLGDAWGLTAAFVFDPAARNGAIYLIGGPGTDPETYKGHYSSRSRYEEKIMTALYRRAILNTDQHER